MNGLNMPDYYQLLGLNYDAQGDEITKSYQSICEKFSIFLYSTREEISSKNKDFVIYKDAFDTLSDKETRLKYDKFLKDKINESALMLEQTHSRLISETSDLDEQFFHDNNIKVELSRVKDEILKENFNKGKKFLNEGAYHEAINVFRKLINMKPNESKYHSYLALALEKKGWTAYAEEEFKNSLDINSEDEIAKKYFDNKNNSIVPKNTTLLDGKDISNSEYLSIIDRVKKFFKIIIE
ncbi:MAG: hypothetical protein U0354_13855 [Candidatus Sericytochromatia bacterium]